MAVDIEKASSLSARLKCVDVFKTQLAAQAANVEQARKEVAAAATPEAKVAAAGKLANAEQTEAAVKRSLDLEMLEAALIEKQPPADYDASSGRLSLPLSGYGVRLILLK